MIEYTPQEDVIPVFVKDGTLIPTLEYSVHASASSQIVIVVPYGNTEGSSTYVYDDKGETTSDEGVRIRLGEKDGKLERTGEFRWYFTSFTLSPFL